jgi:hypothetical protein
MGRDPAIVGAASDNAADVGCYFGNRADVLSVCKAEADVEKTQMISPRMPQSVMPVQL